MPLGLTNLPQAITTPSCSTCPLYSEKVIPVLGQMKQDVDVLIIGEAPGQEEALKGEPFIGYSGQLIRKYLAAIGLTSYSLTNVCLCRPKDNATPSSLATSSCRGRLMSEIEYINPKKILCLGSTASEALTGKKITKALNRYIPFQSSSGRTIPVLSTYHPAAVLRLPELYRDMSDGIDKLAQEPRWDWLPRGADGYPILEYEVIDTREKLVDWYRDKTHNVDAWVLDIETRWVEWHDKDNRLLAIGLMNREDEKIYIIPAEIALHSVVGDLLRRFLSRKDHTLVIQNAPFEYLWMKHLYGVRLPNIQDTLAMHYSLDERSGSDSEAGGAQVAVHSLKYLGGLYFDLPDWSDLMKPYKKDYGLAPTEILYRYLAVDLWTEHKLHQELHARLVQEDSEIKRERNRRDPEGGYLVKQAPTPIDAYYNVMLPAITTLSDMTYEGVLVDKPYLEEKADEWNDIIEGKKGEINDLIGRGININSPKQLQVLLYDELGMRPMPGKGKSTDKEVLDYLYKKTGNPVVELIRETRQLRHIRSTYLVGLLDKISPNGRIHTNFLIHGTDTGRLAARNPNLQNQPARIGSIIRDAFIADPGWIFGDPDYKQLEFRVLAYYSLDAKLIQFINEGRDIHSEVAAQFFGIEPGTETDQQRITTKAFVFGVIYQRGVESIAEEYGIPLKEATRRHNMLYSMFPDIKSWMATTMDRAIADGYVESAFGRRRRFPFVTSRNRADIQRYAVNTPIQSMASDVNLIRATEIRQELVDDTFKSLLLVHDSHLAMAREDVALERFAQMRDIMERKFPNSPVDFKVDVKMGTRWGSLEKVKIA